MSEDDFFQRLRDDARHLRYDADDVMVSRLTARIRQRVAVPPTVAQFLAGWFRPLAVSLVSVALIATLGVQWLDSAPDPSLEMAMSSGSVEISIDGDSYGLAD